MSAPTTLRSIAEVSGCPAGDLTMVVLPPCAAGASTSHRIAIVPVADPASARVVDGDDILPVTQAPPVYAIDDASTASRRTGVAVCGTVLGGRDNGPDVVAIYTLGGMTTARKTKAATMYAVGDDAVVQPGSTAIEDSVMLLPEPRSGGIAAVDGDELYYIGGVVRSGNVPPEHGVLRQSTFGWVGGESPAFPADHDDVDGACVVDGTIYVKFSSDHTIWRHAPSDDDWVRMRAGGKLPFEMCGMPVTLCVAGAFLIACGDGRVARYNFEDDTPWVLDDVRDVACVVGTSCGNAVCAIRRPGGNVLIAEDCTFGPSRTDINAMARSPRVHTLASLDELTAWRAVTERSVRAARQRNSAALVCATRECDKKKAAAAAELASFTYRNECNRRDLDAAAATIDNVKDIEDEFRAAKRPRTADSGPAERPLEHICSITRRVMDDPVTAADGNSYERAAIEAWLANHDTSPLTNAPMATTLLENRALRKLINDWLDGN